MTEFWKSHAMHYCELCKVWLNDNPATKATHENGLKHKENVTKRLREMRKKQDKEKKTTALAERSMSAIEAAAQRQFEMDQQEAKEAFFRMSGQWVLDEKAGYFYNAAHRHYYDPDSDQYYGGDPAEWTAKPQIPPEALFPKKQPDKPVAGSRRAPAPKKIYHHPLADIGGFQMPTTGAVGGAKGIGRDKRKAEEQPQATSKRKQPSKPVTPEEQAAITAREAARARVAKRTAQTFGLA